MQSNNKSRIIKILIFLVITILIGVFMKNNYFLYDTPIGVINSIENKVTDTKSVYDGKRNYSETYYHQIIKATLVNTSQKGNTITLENDCTKSGVYDTKYSKNDVVFIENIKENKGVISSSKRDYQVVIVITILFGLFLLTCGKSGLLTIISLVLNMIAYYFVLLLYTNGYNLLLLTIPMTIFFTAILLFFMYGNNEKTILSFVATMISVALTTIIAVIVIHLSPNIDYDFMDYLIVPYEQSDANNIFISEILIGCLGAIMDVVVTVIMTVNQIVATTPNIETKDLIKSCRQIGDDVVGTMINIMFFTNIAASLPFFLLSMRNGIAIHTILKHNIFFELARFLTGSIGTVLSIPVSAFIVIYYYRKKVKKC